MFSLSLVLRQTQNLISHQAHKTFVYLPLRTQYLIMITSAFHLNLIVSHCDIFKYSASDSQSVVYR